MASSSALSAVTCSNHHSNSHSLLTHDITQFLSSSEMNSSNPIHSSSISCGGGGLIAHAHAVDGFALNIIDELILLSRSSSNNNDNTKEGKDNTSAAAVSAFPSAKAVLELAQLAWNASEVESTQSEKKEQHQQQSGDDMAPVATSPSSSSFIHTYAKVIRSEEFLRRYVRDYIYNKNNEKDEEENGNTNTDTDVASSSLTAMVQTIRQLRQRIDAAFIPCGEERSFTTMNTHNNNSNKIADCDPKEQSSLLHSSSSSAQQQKEKEQQQLAATYEKTFHMNPKKVYEVATMAPFIHNQVTRLMEKEKEVKNENKRGESAEEGEGGEEPLTVLVDIGAGQGYLSAALCLPPYNYTVIAVEREGNNCHGSLKSSRAVQQLLLKQKQQKNEKEKATKSSVVAVQQKKKKRDRSPPTSPLLDGRTSQKEEEEEDCGPNNAGSESSAPNTLKPCTSSSSSPSSAPSGRLLVAKLEVNGDTRPDALLKMVADAVYADKKEEKEGNNRQPLRIVFISLHACGGLSHQMLRLFVECGDLLKKTMNNTNQMNGVGDPSSLTTPPPTPAPLLPLGSSAPLLVNVGCCYNLIDDSEAGEKREAPSASAAAAPFSTTTDNSNGNGKPRRNYGTFPLSNAFITSFNGKDKCDDSSGTATTSTLRTVTLGRDGTLPLTVYYQNKKKMMNTHNNSEEGSTTGIHYGGGHDSSNHNNKGFMLTRNMRQAACQCPSRWGSFEEEHHRRDGDAVAAAAAAQTDSTTTPKVKRAKKKDPKQQQQQEEGNTCAADGNNEAATGREGPSSATINTSPPPLSEDAQCQLDVLTNFELNYQRALVQTLLQEVMGQHDLRRVSKAIVRYQRHHSNNNNNNSQTQQQPSATTSGGTINSTTQTNKVKASERDTTLRIAALRDAAATAATATSGMNATSTTAVSGDDWLLEMQRMYAEEYALPSCENLRQSMMQNLMNIPSSDDNASPTTTAAASLPIAAAVTKEFVWSQYVAHMTASPPASTSSSALCSAPSSSNEYPLLLLPPQRVILSALWALRAIVGELTEQVILLDRALYLRECTATQQFEQEDPHHNASATTSASSSSSCSFIAQPLDPYKSPRCYAVVSRRL